MRFDWVDFGVSGLKNESEPFDLFFDKQLHNSTASLLAQVLRHRSAPRGKVFCWLRQPQGVLETSNTPTVHHIEASFPFDAYRAADTAKRLIIFARWLVATLAIGVPELVTAYEIDDLVARLTELHFTYVRHEKFKAVPGGAPCMVVYRHTPTTLSGLALCSLPNGVRVERAFEHDRLRPDEMVYGRAIKQVILSESGEIELEAFFGRF